MHHSAPEVSPMTMLALTTAVLLGSIAAGAIFALGVTVWQRLHPPSA
jgi:hypothetical protein